jgi:protein gp37
MNKTKIEWCDYTWNPITGCTVGCSYCYAKKIVDRFPDNYPKGFFPTFHPHRILESSKVKTPSRIFTCSMGDFWDTNITDSQRAMVIWEMWKNPQHRYIILTKRPENITDVVEYKSDAKCVPAYIKLPDNLWLGVTVEYPGTEDRIDTLIRNTSKNRFVSFEPLLGMISPCLIGIDWIIIGAQTNPNKQPDQNWIIPIIEEADRLSIPVFEKDNLEIVIRKEYPKELTKPFC